MQQISVQQLVSNTGFEGKFRAIGAGGCGSRELDSDPLLYKHAQCT